MSTSSNMTGANNATGLQSDGLSDVQLIIVHKIVMTAFTCVLCITVIGIVLNLFVFIKLLKIHIAKPDLNPATVLMCMCATDSISLALTLFHSLTRQPFLGSAHIGVIWKRVFCKSTYFVVHTLSAFGFVSVVLIHKIPLKMAFFSVWAWIILSGQRFISLVCPIMTHHSKIILKSTWWQIGILLFCCGLSQIWIIFEFDYQEKVTCDFSTSNDSTIFLIVDTIIVFIIPAVSTLVMDIYARYYMKKKVDDLAGAQQPSVERMLNASSSLTQSVLHTNTGGSNSNYSFFASPKNSPRKGWLLSRFHSYANSATNSKSRSNSDSHQQQQRKSKSKSVIESMEPTNSVRRRQIVTRLEAVNDARKKRNQRLIRRLRRYLYLTCLDLALNFPNVILVRFVYSTGYNPSTGKAVLAKVLLTSIAMIVYYGQFSLNILYLWVLVGHRKRRDDGDVDPTINLRSMRNPKLTATDDKNSLTVHTFRRQTSASNGQSTSIPPMMAKTGSLDCKQQDIPEEDDSSCTAEPRVQKKSSPAQVTYTTAAHEEPPSTHSAIISTDKRLMIIRTSVDIHMETEAEVRI